MLSIEKIHQRCHSRYQTMLRQWDCVASLFPLQIPLGKISGTHKEVYQWVSKLSENDQQNKQNGYIIRSKEIHSRSYGKNHFPTHIEFTSANHLAAYLGKLSEWNKIDECYQYVAEKHSPILPDLLNSPTIGLTVSQLGQPFFTSLDWMISHAGPACYLREIPVLPHSKYIEDNVAAFRFFLERLLPDNAINHAEEKFERRFGYLKVEHFFNVKLLDPELRSSLDFPFEQLALHPTDIAKIRSEDIQKVIIVENQVNLHTLPRIAATLAIHGNGYALARLKNIRWMQDIPVYYWGDIDVFGYEILSELRKSYPQAKSLMMEPPHIRQLSFISSLGKRSIRKTSDFIHLLTPLEKIAHRWCQIYDKRIEQERIPMRLSHEFLDQLIHRHISQAEH